MSVLTNSQMKKKVKEYVRSVVSNNTPSGKYICPQHVKQLVLSLGKNKKFYDNIIICSFKIHSSKLFSVIVLDSVNSCLENEINIINKFYKKHVEMFDDVYDGDYNNNEYEPIHCLIEPEIVL